MKRWIVVSILLGLLFVGLAAAEGAFGGFGGPSLGSLRSGSLPALEAVGEVQRAHATPPDFESCDRRYRSFEARNGMSPARRRAALRACLTAAMRAKELDVARDE